MTEQEAARVVAGFIRAALDNAPRMSLEESIARRWCEENDCDYQAHAYDPVLKVLSVQGTSRKPIEFVTLTCEISTGEGEP